MERASSPARRPNSPTRKLGGAGAWCAALAFAVVAHAQMTIPTTGVVPAGVLDRSLILGDDLADFQSMWASPLNPVQQGWRNQINGVANGSITGTPPATFSAAASQAGIAEAAALRYAMTGTASDLAKVVSALLVADVPPDSSGNSFIIRPEVVTSYLSAYDFIRGAPLADLPVSTRAAIEARLTTLTASLSNGNQTLSNARGKIGGTRALAGVVLQNQALLDEGLSDLNAHFGYSTTDDGWFTDAPGPYLNYTLRHISLFARAYEQGSGVDLYPNLDPYIQTTLGMRLPDGSSPNVSNGLAVRAAVYALAPTTDPESAASALWHLTSGLPANYNGYAGTNVFNNTSSPASFFALINFAKTAPAPPDASPTYLADGQSKVSVFRNDWSTTSDYLLLSPGIDSPASTFDISGFLLVLPAFHSHNDSMEILLASKGQYILVAPGYERTDLSNSPAGFTPKNSDWHNVVLVDGNVGVVADPVQSPILGRTRRPEDFVHTNRLDSTEFGDYRGVGDFASLETEYNQTAVRRSIAHPNEDYFVVADRMQSDSSHAYGFNLVGRGAQTVLVDSADRMEVMWESGGSMVIEHLFSTHSMTLSTEPRSMHYGFNQFETTRRMLAEINGENALFLSVLETGWAGQGSSLAITRLATSADAIGVLIEHATSGWTDTVLTQLGHEVRTAGDVASDANYAYVRRAAGGLLESAMLAEGTALWLDGDLVFDLSDRGALSLLFDLDLVLGTVSADGWIAGTTLAIYGRGPISGAWLDGAPIGFSNAPGYGSVEISGGGALRIEFGVVPETGSLTLAGVACAAAGALFLRRRGPKPQDALAV